MIRMATSLVGAGKWEGKLKEESARERKGTQEGGVQREEKNWRNWRNFWFLRQGWLLLCFFFSFSVFFFSSTRAVYPLKKRKEKNQDGHRLIGTLLSPCRYTTLITEGQAHVPLIWKSNVPYVCSYNYWTVISAHVIPQWGGDGVECICIKI